MEEFTYGGQWEESPIVILVIANKHVRHVKIFGVVLS